MRMFWTWVWVKNMIIYLFKVLNVVSSAEKRKKQPIFVERTNQKVTYGKETLDLWKKKITQV